MKNQLIVFCTFLNLLGIQFIWPLTGLAYKSSIHQKITSVAMEQKASLFKKRLKEIGFQNGIDSELKGYDPPNNIQKLIKYGSHWEDGIIVRYYYDDFFSSSQGIMYCHFYNPRTKEGFEGKLPILGTAVKGESLIDRANNYPDNEWSYPIAKHFLYAALTGDSTGYEGRREIRYGAISKNINIIGFLRNDLNEIERDLFFSWAFQALGHNMHLIQDASVPSHTRNDSHDWREPYETWTNEMLKEEEKEKVSLENSKMNWLGPNSDSWNYWKEYSTAFPNGTIAPGISSNSYHAFIDLNTPNTT